MVNACYNHSLHLYYHTLAVMKGKQMSVKVWTHTLFGKDLVQHLQNEEEAVSIGHRHIEFSRTWKNT